MLESLVQRLCTDKGFTSASDVALPSDASPPELAFLGVRSYWRSIMSVGLLRADHHTGEELAALADDLHRFTRALRPLAGSVSSTRLGSFGLFLLIFESCSREQIASVRSLKRGSAWRKDYLVPWACDLHAGRVHAHRGFPLVMYPGRRYIEASIRGLAG